jgi:hypothetical protein
VRYKRLNNLAVKDRYETRQQNVVSTPPIFIKPEAIGVFACFHNSVTKRSKSGTIHEFTVITQEECQEFSVTIDTVPCLNFITNDDDRHVENNLPNFEGGVPIMPIKSKEIFLADLCAGVTVGTKEKGILSACISLYYTCYGANPCYLLAAVSALAIGDWVLGLIPGAAKPGREAEYTLKARLWDFVLNMGAIFFLVIFKIGITEGFPRIAEIDNLLIKFLINIDYLGMGLVFSIYLGRIIGYIYRKSGRRIPMPKYFSKFIDM